MTQHLALLWSDFFKNSWVSPVLCQARQASRCGCGAFRNPRISSISSELRSNDIAVFPSIEDAPISCEFAISLGNPRGAVNTSVFVCVFYMDIVSRFLLQRKTIGCSFANKLHFQCHSVAIILITTHEGFGSLSCLIADLL